jgi:hypothetical protein
MLPLVAGGCAAGARDFSLSCNIRLPKNKKQRKNPCFQMPRRQVVVDFRARILSPSFRKSTAIRWASGPRLARRSATPRSQGVGRPPEIPAAKARVGARR